MVKRIFVIRDNGFVEFRSSTIVPEARVSKMIVCKKVSDIKYGFDEVRGYYQEPIMVKKKMTLATTFYVGGTTLGYMSIRKFRKLFPKVVFNKKSISELIEMDSKTVSNPKWRRENLV